MKLDFFQLSKYLLAMFKSFISRVFGLFFATNFCFQFSFMQYRYNPAINYNRFFSFRLSYHLKDIGFLRSKLRRCFTGDIFSLSYGDLKVQTICLFDKYGQLMRAVLEFLFDSYH